jgi:hypothetical protein
LTVEAPTDEAPGALSPPEKATLDRNSLAYNDELSRNNHYIAAEALQPVRSARTVRVRHGKASIRPEDETAHMLLRFSERSVGNLYALCEAGGLGAAIVKIVDACVTVADYPSILHIGKQWSGIEIKIPGYIFWNPDKPHL